jgi:alpha-1,6-mannosyltransferase
MRQDSTQSDGSVVLAAGTSPGAGTGTAESTPGLPKLAPLASRLTVRPARITLGGTAGRIALGVLLLGALLVVLFSTAHSSALVPTSQYNFPSWEAGPLHGLFGYFTLDQNSIDMDFSAVVVLMLVAYGAVLLAVRSLSLRVIVVCVVALNLLLLMGPQLQLTDLFNYLGYARLGAVHHLNPYTHGIVAELHDPVYRFSTWHNLHSPYGPLFTAISYPIALLPLPAAYWVLKVFAVGLSLAFIAIVAKCARLLGRDPRFAIAFVAFNPIYLIYAVGGFHNDFVMLVPSTAAIALLLARRDRSAGAALMLAVAVKFTAILLLPFLLIAAIPPQRRVRVLTGAAMALVPLGVLSLALFGLTIPNLQDQSTLLTDFSVPNVVGDLIGVGGGTPLLLRFANVAVVVTVIYFLRRRRDWIGGAGWSTLALVISLAWLVPWYVVWVLPLAALGSSVRLRQATLLFTVYLVFAFIPATGIWLSNHGIDLMGGSAGQASMSLQHKLAG